MRNAVELDARAIRDVQETRNFVVPTRVEAKELRDEAGRACRAGGRTP